MESHWIKKLVILFLVSTVATISQTAINDYCTKANGTIRCVYRNTNQTVRLSDTQDTFGSRQLEIESAPALQGVVPCNLLLQVWSSDNVTLTGGTVEGERSGDRDPTAPEGLVSGYSATSSTQRPIIFEDDPPKTSVEAGETCVRNMSAQQSKFLSLRGKFDCVKFRFSEIKEIEASFSHLSLRDSQVLNLSAFVDRVSLNGSTVATMKDFEVGNSVDTNDLNIVKIEKIENEGLRVKNSDLRISKSVLGEVYFEGIMVVNGSLKIENSLIVKGSPECLVLQGKSRVVLSNVTFGSRFIEFLDLSSAGQIIYPFQFISLSSKGVGLRLGVPNTHDSEIGDISSFQGLQWYWIVIMLGVGLVAGLVLGSAVRCPNTKDPRIQASSLTLADLINRDRMEEGDSAEEGESRHRPQLLRQDSGLTSSSFASYTACPDRRRLSLLKQPEDLDQILTSRAEPNIYLQVSPLACAQDTVIYEEVEHFPPEKENVYLTMTSGVKQSA